MIYNHTFFIYLEHMKMDKIHFKGLKAINILLLLTSIFVSCEQSPKKVEDTFFIEQPIQLTLAQANNLAKLPLKTNTQIS